MIKNNTAANLCKELLIFFALFFFPAFFAGSNSPDPALFERWSAHSTILLHTLPRIAFLIFYLHRTEFQAGETFHIHPPRRGDLPRAAGLALILFFTMVFLSRATLLLPHETLEALEKRAFVWEMNRPWMLVPVLVTSLSVGLWEELFFRVYLLTRFQQLGIPPLPALILGSLIFTSGHIYEGPAAMVMIFILGLFLGHVYHRYKSWVIPSVAHGLYNFLVLLMTYLQSLTGG